MTPEEKAQEIERALSDRKDADQVLGDKLDKIMSGLDSVNKRMDAIESTRKDADDETKDKEADNEIDADDRKMRKDGNLDGKKETKDADYITANQELVKAQMRADSVSAMFGSQAPRPMDGEQPHAYRVRLLKNFQHNSPDFKEVDLKTIADPATFDAVEARIYADSKSAAATPLVPTGYLQEVQTRDQSGRAISKFYGEPRTWMDQFMMEPWVVVGFNKDGK